MKCDRRIISGELHYPRIPREYWSDRLAMARAMGLDTVSTYVFWNCHERRPGVYDFENGNDVAAFIELARDHGLDVLLRPGPYVCAEWDLGGLPSWLLKDGAIPLRSTDSRFMRPVRRWLMRLGEELARYLRSNGGPIIAVQLENEYGAFAADSVYLQTLRNILSEAGFDGVPLYTIDQPADLQRGSLPDLPIAVTFAPGDAGIQFRELQRLRPDEPLLCGEYWAGWFDHWGEPRAADDAAVQVNDAEWMVRNGVSLNFYMFHGGTNFGFWNGANDFEPFTYQPTATSYDYQAAVDEAGRPTPKYSAFRDMLARCTARVPPPVPERPPLIVISPFELTQCATVLDNIGEGIHASRLLTMEEAGQDFGFILYRANFDVRAAGTLRITGIRDYAVVLLDGKTLAHLDRRLGQEELQIPEGCGDARLDILVENCGRINYGRGMLDQRKGILGGVSFRSQSVCEWTVYPLPLTSLEAIRWNDAPCEGPAFYRGSFEVAAPGDTFIETGNVGKGVLWINGHNAGRCWRIGPQRRLFVPGVWLREGQNEAIVLDLFDRTTAPVLRSGEDAFDQ